MDFVCLSHLRYISTFSCLLSIYEEPSQTSSTGLKVHLAGYSVLLHYDAFCLSCLCHTVVWWHASPSCLSTRSGGWDWRPVSYLGGASSVQQEWGPVWRRRPYRPVLPPTPLSTPARHKTQIATSPGTLARGDLQGIAPQRPQVNPKPVEKTSNPWGLLQEQHFLLDAL